MLGWGDCWNLELESWGDCVGWETENFYYFTHLLTVSYISWESHVSGHKNEWEDTDLSSLNPCAVHRTAKEKIQNMPAVPWQFSPLDPSQEFYPTQHLHTNLGHMLTLDRGDFSLVNHRTRQACI